MAMSSMALLLGSGSALASGKCSAPMAEWQPREALQTKLEADGYKVNRIKTDDGCYEVYAVGPDGKRMKAYFDPKSFEQVKGEDAEEGDDSDGDNSE
jgi:hypothetical protein